MLLQLLEYVTYLVSKLVRPQSISAASLVFVFIILFFFVTHWSGTNDWSLNFCYLTEDQMQ